METSEQEYSMKVGMRLVFSSLNCEKCRAFLCALVLLSALVMMAFPLAAKESRDFRDRVMVFGDSLSAAYGIDAKDGWVTLLEKKLRPQGIAVVNASVSGETTRGGLARIKTDLARLHPTIVVVALGANDGLRGLPNADTRKNLEAIIAAARTANAKVVLVGIQIPPNYGLEYAAQFRDIYPDLAAKYKLPLVPFLLEGIADKFELFQTDRLHPTAAAQPMILGNVVPAVFQAIAKTSGGPRR